MDILLLHRFGTYGGNMWCDEYNIKFCMYCKLCEHPHAARGLCSNCIEKFYELDEQAQKTEWRRMRQRMDYHRQPSKYKEKNRKSHQKHKEVRNQERREHRKNNPHEYKKKDKERYARDREKRCEQARTFRANNPDKVSFWNRRWYENNKNRHKEYKKLYNNLNKEKVAENKKRYYLANRDKILEKHKVYYRIHKAQIQQYRIKYYSENRERILVSNKQYHLENREKRIAYSRNYYAINKSKLLSIYREKRSANPQLYNERARAYRVANKGRINKLRRERYQRDRDKILTKIRLNNYALRQKKLDPREEEKRCLSKIHLQLEKAPAAFRDLMQNYITHLFDIREKKINRGGVNYISFSTIYSYTIILRQFLEKVYKDKISIKEISVNYVQRYIDNCGYTAISVLKRFFKLCIKERKVTYNPVTRIKRPRQKAPKFGKTVSDEYKIQLFNIIFNPSTPPPQALVLMLALLHGLTHGQIRYLLINDIDFSFNRLYINKFTGESHFIYLDSEEKQVLFRYLDYRANKIGPLPNPDYLMVVYNSILSNKPVGFNTLSSIIKEVDETLTIGILRNTWLKDFLFVSEDVRLTAQAAGYNPRYLAKKIKGLGVNI